MGEISPSSSNQHLAVCVLASGIGSDTSSFAALSHNPLHLPEGFKVYVVWRRMCRDSLSHHHRAGNEGSLLPSFLRFLRQFCLSYHLILRIILPMIALCLINGIPVRILQVKEEGILTVPQLDTAHNNPTPHIILPALSDCYDKWRPKAWTQWTPLPI